MKKCPNGHEVSDNVKFCPHCGAQVTSRRSKKTEIHNNQNLSITERIALGIAGFVAFVGLCGGFADSMWITVIASVCALTAVCAVFKGYIEKKYAWTIAICSFLAVFIAIGATAPDREHFDEDSSKGENISQKVEQTEKEDTKPLKGSKDQSMKDELAAFAGNYLFSCYIGDTNAKMFFELSLKSDGTFSFKPGNESTRELMDIGKVIDGLDYPDGGKWKVEDSPVGRYALLEFDCSWGDGTISPDKSVIQINNMNGTTLKTQLTR